MLNRVTRRPPRAARRHLMRATVGLVAALALTGCGSSKSSGPTGPSGSPTSLSITPSNPLIEPGTTQQFTATARNSDGSTTNVTGTVTWSTSNTAVMAISNDSGNKGLASRFGDGSVDVTATLGALSTSLPVSVWSTVMASTLTFDPAAATGFAIGRLVAGANEVCWAEYGALGGSIETVSKAGGTPITLASGLGGINALTCDGTHVYWTEFATAGGAGAVKRIPFTGGSVEVLATGTPAGSAYDVFFPGGITVDDTYVYWGEPSGGGAIRRVPKSGGTVVDLGRGQGFGPSSLAIGGGYLYGVTNNGGTGIAARLPIGDGTVEILATGVVNPANLALDADALYWAELVSPNGRIMRLPLSGGAPVALATGIDNPHSVEVESAHAYYTGAAGPVSDRRNGVWKVPVGGGTATLVVGNAGTANGFDPLTVALDATHIFLVDAAGSTTGQGRVLRAPRE